MGIKCVNVNLLEVLSAFEDHSELEIESFLLHFPRTTDIPADLIGIHNRITKEIDLKCSKTGFYSLRQLKIHRYAFRSSRNYTRALKLAYCDLSTLDFSFLEEFTQLEILHITHSVSVHQADWSSLTRLPKFSTLYIESCRINGWTKFPKLASVLRKMSLFWDDIDDSTMDRILDWLLSTSSETLQELYITLNALTRFPVKISSFKNLRIACLTNQVGYSSGISFLPSGSYVSSNSLKRLELRDCGIRYIQPGAFSGNKQCPISNTHININPL